MFLSAQKTRDEHLVRATTFDDFCKALNSKNLLLSPWCEDTKCEESVKERSANSGTNGEEQDEKAPSMGAKTLCIPFKQPHLAEGTKCFACEKKAKSWTLWGRSY